MRASVTKSAPRGTTSTVGSGASWGGDDGCCWSEGQFEGAAGANRGASGVVLAVLFSSAFWVGLIWVVRGWL